MDKDIFTQNDMIKLQKYLKENNQTITCAESCTGGLCAHMITQIPGSSSIFKGAVVTYCNDIKEQELNVKKETMIKYGAVSIQTVSQMLDGVLKKFNANYAIAISGIAGPGGGSIDKPTGTVVIGIMSKTNGKKIDIFHFKGDRISIQNQAAKTAFKIIFKSFFKNT